MRSMCLCLMVLPGFLTGSTRGRGLAFLALFLFSALYKNDGNDIIRLGHSAVKQIAGKSLLIFFVTVTTSIAFWRFCLTLEIRGVFIIRDTICPGRAGRRNSPFPEGEVTCRDPRDLPYLRDCLTTEIEPIKKAGLIPTVSHVEKFAEAFQYYHYGGNTNADGEEVTPNLHTVLKEFSDMAVVKGDYFLCRVRRNCPNVIFFFAAISLTFILRVFCVQQHHMVVISTWLKDIPLDISQKYEFCMAPVSTGEANKNGKEILIKFGQKLSANEVPGMTRGSLVKRAQTFAE
jgi:Suv3 C-terminal domain 1